MEKNKSFFFLLKHVRSFILLILTSFFFILCSRSLFSGEFFFQPFIPIYNFKISFLFNDFFGNDMKTILIQYSYLRKYFTIKKQLPLVQIIYQSTITIGNLVFSSYCIYSSDPQTTKISLLPTSISISRN